jgi:hypothetical protein
MRTPLIAAMLVGLFATKARAETEAQPQTQGDDDKTAAAVKKALEEDRKVRREQEDADKKAKQERDAQEAAFKKEAVTFHDFVVGTVTNGSLTSVTNATVAYRNGRKLSTEEFFVAVERPDLAAKYRSRTKLGWTTTVVSGAVMLAGTAYLLKLPGSTANRCDTGSSDFSACFDRETARTDAETKRVLTIATGLTAGGLVGVLVGSFILRTRNPSSVNEAHDMADAHNAKLRKKYGLPTAQITPYASPAGGGVAMVGRF